MLAPSIIILNLIIVVIYAVEDKYLDGRYITDQTGGYNPLIYDGGKYYHDDSGRYIPDYSGLYRHDGLGYYANDGTGLYKADASGKYDRRKYNRYRPNVGRYKSKYSTLTTTTPPPPPRKLKTNRSAEELQEKYEDLSVGQYKQDVKPIIKRKIPRYDGHWKIIRQAGGVGKSGYNYLYETENKILAEEKASVTNKGSEDESIKSKGFYQYVGDDDMEYKLTYTADENGFIPQGDHLPPSIVRLLEYHKAHG